MGDDQRILRFQYKGMNVDVNVDMDRSNLLDVIIEYEDKAREVGLETCKNPDFHYVWRMKHWPIQKDKDLMTMFERLPGNDFINIWVEEQSKHSALNKLVLELRKTQSKVAQATVLPFADGHDLGKIVKLPVWRNANEKSNATEATVDLKPYCNDVIDGKFVNDHKDRVEAHFKTYPNLDYGVNKGKELQANNTNEIEVNNANEIDFEETWADIIAENGLPLDDPKAFNKFLNDMKKKKKATNKAQCSSVIKPKGTCSFDVVVAPLNIPKNNENETSSTPKSKALPHVVNLERRSPEIGGGNTNIPETQFNLHKSDTSLFSRKIPKTTAIRKGLYIASCKTKNGFPSTQTKKRQSVSVSIATTENGDGPAEENLEENCAIELESASDGDSDNDGGFSEQPLRPFQQGERSTIPHVEDNWEPVQWHDFLDKENDDDYFARLYRNGELYEEKKFGKIELREWMIFTEKSHFKDTLKDYCVQEGFAITVLWADNMRYTAICAAECCDWRVHASKLADGRTWAIKNIWPNVHNCRGLQTHNPICTVKWAAPKLMEYIRGNPDCKGNDLNEHLFNTYGIYMKKSSLYNLKAYVINELFGGDDKSYGLLPPYKKMILETNPNSIAFYSCTEIGHPHKELQFSSMFISFAAQLKGFVTGCRSLIGVDGTHLKGNYGGILLSAIALDGNNEIFPLAYAVVGIENEDNWSYFFWNLYNQLKDAGRDDWTIISDRQKGVDLALKNVWPSAKRRYCCRHLSRNFKKTFLGPLMYILFWRACNATNPYSFKKAMERLRKEGKIPVMEWFAQLGNQEKWTKHKFDPNLCCDTNTSNFVESFNSTLGVDRCRPILTLLEGIRRVCMVRIATRQEQCQNWDEDGICPKIVKLIKEIGQSTKFCTSHMSAPGEFEIHEGNSQFPQSLNKGKCACGAWQLTGIPCRHAIRAMIYSKLDPHNYVSRWYSVKKYKATYSSNIAPIPDYKQWPDFEDLPQILPPPVKRGVGRPCRNRRREEGEQAKGKRAKTIRCKNCGHFGHNVRTCKGGPTQRETAADGPLVTKNKRKKNQSSKGNNQTKKAKQVQEVPTQTGSQPSSLSQVTV